MGGGGSSNGFSDVLRVAWLVYRLSCIVVFCPVLLSVNKNGDDALMLGAGFALMPRYHVPYFDVN
jgi:hypothetical protein